MSARHALRQALLLVLLCPAAGCSNGATLVVDLRTDLRPDFEFRSVELLVTAAGGSLARRARVPALRHDDFLAGQRLSELVDLASGSYTLDTNLLDGAGNVVITRRTSLELHGNLAVVVVVTRDCRGLVCPRAGAPSDTACFGGRCVSQQCADGVLAACPPPLCDLDADCASTIPCAPSICRLGVCLARPDDTRCAANEWCDPSSGCTAIPAALLDAGARDAGAADAGARDAAAVDATTDTGCVPGGACDTGRECELGAWQCTGSARTCVATGPRPAGQTCRAASGGCDAEEQCDGASPTCPADHFVASGVCRGSAGPCDQVESCDGSGPDCPTDRFYGSGRGCRAGHGVCDPGESCDGSGPDCPADDVASNGTNCGATWSEHGCGPIDVSACQDGSCVHDGAFSGNQPSCGAIGGFCGFTPQCCGSGNMFCITGGAIYGSSSDCGQCCAQGNCCMNGNPAGPCI